MSSMFIPTSSQDVSIVGLWAVFGDVISKVLAMLGTPDANQIPQYAAQYGLIAQGATSMPFNLSSIIGLFGTAVLFLGSLLLLWNCVFGLFNTAKDGEALGKQWSTFYMPLRTVTALSLLFPTSLGYSGVQILMFVFTMWSVGISNSIWTTYVTGITTSSFGSIAKESISQTSTTNKLVDNYAAMLVCGAAVDAAVKQAMPNITVEKASEMQLKQKQSVTTNGTTLRTLVFSMYNKAYDVSSVCGANTISLNFTKAFSFPGTGSVTNIFNPDTANIEASVTVLNQSIYDIFKDLPGTPQNKQALLTVIQQIISAASTDSATVAVSAYSKARDDIGQDMVAAITKAVETSFQPVTSNLTASLTKGGWALAGSQSRQLATIKDQIRGATNLTTAISTTPPTWDISSIVGTNSDVLKATQQTIRNYSGIVNTLIAKSNDPNSPPGNPWNTTVSVQGSSSNTPSKFCGLTMPSMPTADNAFTNDFNAQNFASSFVSNVSQGIIQAMVSSVGKGGLDPVMQVKDMGDCLIDITGVGLIGIITAKAAVDTLQKAVETGAIIEGIAGGGILGQIPGVTEAKAGAAVGAVGIVVFLDSFLTQIFDLLRFVFGGLGFIAFWMAVSLPMIPFIMFLSAVIAWLIGQIEAIFAAPLWVMMHLTPGNDSFVGGQSQGYTLVLVQFMRAPLLTVALIASMLLLYPATWMVNQGFITAMGAVQVTTMTGPLEALAFLFVYAGILTNVFIFVFGMPQVIANAILKWIGQGVDSFGSEMMKGNMENKDSVNRVSRGVDGVKADAANSVANSASSAPSAATKGAGSSGTGSGSAASRGSAGSGSSGVVGQGGQSSVAPQPATKQTQTGNKASSQSSSTPSASVKTPSSSSSNGNVARPVSSGSAGAGASSSGTSGANASNKPVSRPMTRGEKVAGALGMAGVAMTGVNPVTGNSIARDATYAAPAAAKATGKFAVKTAQSAVKHAKNIPAQAKRGIATAALTMALMKNRPKDAA